MLSKNSRFVAMLGLILTLVFTAYAADSRTKLKPGWNLFSPQQDIEMGRQSAKEAEKQLPVLNDREAATYINTLGQNLAAHAPGEKYPYQFKIVNDKAINAFALPGGFVYVNRGAIEAADSENQIAGVMAHEIGHVVLRHGTNQVSKAYLAQAPLSILGGMLGSNSIGGVLAQLGVGLGLNSLFLKYSRDAESQADLMGTQILHDSGYDPRGMVEFFEKIQAESKGRAVEFLSDHPNPENRISNVQHEIERLGAAPPNARRDSPDFHTVKSLLAGMPAPKGGGRGGNGPADTRNGKPDAPSGRMATYNGNDLQFRYPDNWHQYGQGSAMTIAPDGGIINGALAYGMMIAEFEPDYHGQSQISLNEATDQLLNNLQRQNTSMRIVRSHERTRAGGQPGLITEASNQSPAGGRETDWIVTAMRPDGVMYYFVGVAPQNDFSRYARAFEDIIDTVKFK
ncbi:MAG TPA: M48 family metalloprotease [Terriglobia bacterium]|nr:M48 family metalloprotease [Terriglobia bacterium]